MSFPDAPKAAERVREAIKKNEKIGIFGDYDCDGITATAELIRMLRRRGVDPLVRLPHRVRDGYGLKANHIVEFAETGVTLILIVDTGISAHRAVAFARGQGIDVVILDHHELLEREPDAFAILHPALVPAFPGPWPSASGIVLAFVQCIEGGSWPGEDEDRALAMIGTIADLVPLAGGNRSIVQQGLEALERLRDAPLAELAASVRSVGKRLSSRDVAFRIAPRINAAGRMADPMLGLRALLEGGEALRDLETLNVLRQGETASAVEHAIMQLGVSSDSFLCAADESYQPGIIGLIAGKLTERFGRPSMAVCVQGEDCTASLRSMHTYSIIDGLQRSAHLFTSFGGHRQAAGCTFPRGNLPQIREALCRDVSLHVSAEHLVPTIVVDAVLPAHAVSLPLIHELAHLEPFGQGNPEPQFLVESVRLEAPRTVGQEGKHLQARAFGHKIIGFGLGELRAHANAPLDLVCRLGIDAWNGREETQLQVVDMRLHEETEDVDDAEDREERKKSSLSS